MPVRIVTLGLALLSQGQDARLFNDSDRAAVVSYWSQPNRYVVAPAVDPRGAWAVRLTAEGSKWLWDYNKARGLGKVNPLIDAGAQNAAQADWEKWIDAKIAYDRYQAALKVSELDAKDLNVTPDAPGADPVEDPGPMPEGLHDLVGDAPVFADAVKPNTYTVTFDDGLSLQFKDQVPVRPRYAYFRWPQGVETGPGLKLSGSDMDKICSEAGLTSTERKVMGAVSRLEGGFDSVNTYDTGFVSVGFIQFACLSAGAGSLGAVLSSEKQSRPDAFINDFRKYGIDVDSTNHLVCVDPANGDELDGPEAAKKIIDDKRLTAVFQRAGEQSEAFQVAQLQAAKAMFYPANDPVTVTTQDGPRQCKVGDIVHSEAGLAILMDRKVNLGNLNPLPSIVNGVVQDTGAKNLDELAAHEMEIVEPLVFRKNYLGDPTLSQPTGVARRSVIVGSRHGDRVPRKPKTKPRAKPKVKPEPPDADPASNGMPDRDSTAGG